MDAPSDATQREDLSEQRELVEASLLARPFRSEQRELVEASLLARPFRPTRRLGCQRASESAGSW
jgi:hypothetical protein